MVSGEQSAPSTGAGAEQASEQVLHFVICHHPHLELTNSQVVPSCVALTS